MPKVSTKSAVLYNEVNPDDLYFYVIEETVPGTFVIKGKINLKNLLSAPALENEGVTAWQNLIKLGLASDALRSLDDANPRAQTSSNGTYYTTATTTNLPSGTNKVGILEVRNQETLKYFRYFTYNAGRLEIWTQHYNGSAWSDWNYANGESSLAFIGGINESGGVVRLSGELDQNVGIILNGHGYSVTGEGFQQYSASDGNEESFLNIYGDKIELKKDDGTKLTISAGQFLFSNWIKTPNRNSLPGNDTENAVGNTVYVTDASTLHMPPTTKVGILEAFDHNESGVELRYTTFTSGVIEIWGRKKSGASWYDWVQFGETANSILQKIGDGSQISSQYLPSYVDDVIEVADYASLPSEGEQGKIYVTIDDNSSYRWSGTAYVSLSNPLDYVKQAEVETTNPTENTKVATIFRVFQGFIYWIANVAFPALNTSSKNLIGAINELQNKVTLADNGLTKDGNTIKTGGTINEPTSVVANESYEITRNEVVFQIGTGFNNRVENLIIQTDGKILAGGIFTDYDGNSVGRFIRLNENGIIDTVFHNNSGAGFSGTIYNARLRSDGKIFAVGQFTSYNGTSRRNAALLNNDGTLDTSFNPPYFDGINYGAEIQADNKMVVCGSFSDYDGLLPNSLVRLNTNGTVDETYISLDDSGFNSAVNAIVMQADEKIIAVGNFSRYNESAVVKIVRLNNDGTIDPSFNVGTGIGTNALELRIQNDGKILAVGGFTTYNGTSVGRIVRINTDGSIDSTFAINTGTGFNGFTRTIEIQSDGKILIGGDFTSFNGNSINRIVRLNSDGTLDATFDPGTAANDSVYTIAAKSNGNIVIGGTFTAYNGDTPNRIFELKASGKSSNLFAQVAFRGTGMGDIEDYEENKTDYDYVTKKMLDAKENINASIASLNANTTLDSTYNGKTIECEGTITITLPDGMPTGYRVDIINVGTGTITIAATTTLQGEGDLLETRYTGASAYHRGSNVWIIVGKLTSR
jgi:uncharacterized delta-60 repeat protein